jgi:hypothetical protein
MPVSRAEAAVFPQPGRDYEMLNESQFRRDVERAFQDLSERVANEITVYTDHGALSGLGDDDHTQYHNDARALTWLGTRSTTDLPEGTNLYYTQARFDTAFAAKDTGDLTEGANLYYTDERVDDRVDALIQDGANGLITWAYDDGAGTLTPSVEVKLNDLSNPDGNTSFNMANKTLTFTFTNPAGGIFIEWTGAASGHLFELQQNTGNPSAGTHLMHIEWVDSDVVGIHLEGAAASDSAIVMDVTGDSVKRLVISNDGKMLWSSGAAAGDTNLYRSAANVLKTDDGFVAGASLAVGSGQTITDSDAIWTGCNAGETIAESASAKSILIGDGASGWAESSGAAQRDFLVIAAGGASLEWRAIEADDLPGGSVIASGGVDTYVPVFSAASTVVGDVEFRYDDATRFLYLGNISSATIQVKRASSGDFLVVDAASTVNQYMTFSADTARIGWLASDGLVISNQNSTFDKVTIKNDTGSLVLNEGVWTFIGTLAAISTTGTFTITKAQSKITLVDTGSQANEMRINFTATTGNRFYFAPAPGGTPDFGKEFIFDFDNDRWVFDTVPYVGANKVWHEGTLANSGSAKSILVGDGSSGWAESSGAAAGYLLFIDGAGTALEWRDLTVADLPAGTVDASGGLDTYIAVFSDSDSLAGDVEFKYDDATRIMYLGWVSSATLQVKRASSGNAIVFDGASTVNQYISMAGGANVIGWKASEGILIENVNATFDKITLKNDTIELNIDESTLTTTGNFLVQKAQANLTVDSTGANQAAILTVQTAGGTGTPTIKMIGRPAVNAIVGDDSAHQYYGFYSVFSNSRTYDTFLRIFGSAASSWGTYLQLTHDGTDGHITTDAGDIKLDPAGGDVVMNTAHLAIQTGYTIKFNGTQAQLAPDASAGGSAYDGIELSTADAASAAPLAAVVISASAASGDYPYGTIWCQY